MPEEEEVNPNDLVLRLNEKANNFDISRYEDFIIGLCGKREYQAESIRKLVKLFLSGEYKNTKELVEENYKNNETLQELYSNVGDLIEELAFKDKLSCTIDLATGTGKTWVMYAVARIMLAEGLVDRVLVLCPSLTIKRELRKKFKKFSRRSDLQNSLPPDAKYRNPGIVDSSETIKEGDICIDNIHRAYEHVSSSIEDSLKGERKKTLVINDEGHHLINAEMHAGKNETEDMMAWARFLKNPEYEFFYILNSSGTPYKGNNYFKDVVYRYSIRTAIEDKFVKDINYLEKDESRNWREKFEAIYNNHEENKKEYPKAKKHITIFVTDRINKTDKIAKEIRDFLKKKEGLSPEEVERRVLPVTSSPTHEENREKLETVDEPENPVEWIVSVSMLTEGWDVDNVFQIVPHEDRAFNSKLLISQVLGRGLRVPPEYRSPKAKHPDVMIYNHDAWTDRIDNLVIAVAEISKRIRSKIDKRSKYNFSSHYMEIGKKIKTKTKTRARARIKLPKSLGFKSTPELREQIYKSVKTGKETVKKTEIGLEEHEIDKAANEIYNSIQLLDVSHGTGFSKKATKDYVKKLIEKELREIGENKVTEPNLQRGKEAFNVLYRKFTGQSRIVPAYSGLKKLNTKEMNASSISLSEIRRNRGLLFSEKSKKKSNEKELKNIVEAIGEIKGKFSMRVENQNYKSPTNVTILSHSNEIKFGKLLTREENSRKIDAWVKSKDKGFYSIPYIHRPGTHSLQREFNPDFIIKKKNKIVIVEIKSDYATDIENRDKLVGAELYFKELNNRLRKNKIKKKYEFHFLTPKDYTTFFDRVIRNDKKFRSELHADLLQKGREELG